MNCFQTLSGKEKMSKGVINYLISGMNGRCRYRAIMIEITSGAFHSVPPTSHGLYVSSPWQVLFLCQAEWLAEYSGTCARITRRITLNIEWAKSNVYKTVTLTWSCKEIVFPIWLLVVLKTLASTPPCPGRFFVRYIHEWHLDQWTQCHRFVVFCILASSFYIIYSV